MSKINHSTLPGTLHDHVASSEKTADGLGLAKNTQKEFQGWTRSNHPGKATDIETFRTISEDNDRYRHGQRRPSQKNLSRWNSGNEAPTGGENAPNDRTNPYAGFSHTTSTRETMTQKEKTGSDIPNGVTKRAKPGEHE